MKQKKGLRRCGAPWLSGKKIVCNDPQGAGTGCDSWHHGVAKLSRADDVDPAPAPIELHHTVDQREQRVV